MIRNLVKSKYLLIGTVVFLSALFAAGCTTTIAEKSGRMANENTTKHVKGYQMGNSESIRLVMPFFAPK